MRFLWNGEDCLGNGWNKNTGDDFEDFVTSVFAEGIDADQLIESTCDLFHYRKCCALFVNGIRVNAGETVVYEDGKLFIR